MGDKVSIQGSNQYRYEYHYTDHLGNTRLSFSDLDGDGDTEATSEIVQEAHYYLFGMELMGLNTPKLA